MTENLEYIDNYFKEAHSRDQSEQFERRLLEEPDFAAEVAFYLSSVQVARDQAMEDRQNRFKALYLQDRQDRPDRQEDPERRKLVPVRRLRTWLAAAAVVAAIVTGWYLFRPSSGPQQLADRYIRDHWQVLGVTMGNKEDSMQMALRAYNEGRLAEAGQQFAAMIGSDSANYEARKYAGIVALRLRHFDEALHYFRQLADYKGLYANPALFYLSVTLLERGLPGDRPEARRLLQQVVDNDLEGKETAVKWLKEF